MYVTGAVHLLFAIAALASGLFIVLRRKGTRTHRRVGRVYALSMIGLNVTALMIYRLTGTFGPFHVAALVSLLTIVGGVLPALRRRPRGGWIERHAYWMSWSYVGLVAAAASEAATRLPGSPFWWMVLLATLLVLVAGGRLIHTGVPVALRPFRPGRG